MDRKRRIGISWGMKFSSDPTRTLKMHENQIEIVTSQPTKI